MQGLAHHPVPGRRAAPRTVWRHAAAALACWAGPACLLCLLAGPAQAQAQAPALAPGQLLPQAPVEAIVGRWVSVSGAEQIEIKSNGYLRSCFVGNKPGSASMGAWTRTGPGKYRVEFTHAVSRACSNEPRMLRRYELSIVGQATASRDELALYVSGEFPPDRFVRAGPAAR